MKVGDKDGHGQYGIIDENPDGLLCHECGKRFKHLSTHVSLGHKIKVADYRERHGLHAQKPLVSQQVRGNMRDSWEKHSSKHLADLDAHRNPLKAVEASREISRNRSAGAKAGRVAALKSRRGRPLTQQEIDVLNAAPGIPEWSELAHKILEDSSVSLRSLAESLGMKRVTAHQRLKRYRPPGWESRGSGNFFPVAETP